MAVSAQDVNKLRQMTGAGMMDCKKALTEAEGDFDQAVEILRKKGQKVSASRSDREAAEGCIFTKVSDDYKEAIIISLNSETDFVAKNDDFQKLGYRIIEEAFNNKPSSIDELMELKIDGLTISEKITELVGVIGEKITIGSYKYLSGELVMPYVHAGNKLGVLVALKNVGGDAQEAAKDIAMQIAAMNPVGVDRDDVPEEVVEQEKSVAKEQALAEGKPENITEKIAQGKLEKFYKENTLLNQAFVKDSDMSVAKYLDSINSGMTVEAFKRVSVED